MGFCVQLGRRRRSLFHVLSIVGLCVETFSVGGDRAVSDVHVALRGRLRLECPDLHLLAVGKGVILVVDCRFLQGILVERCLSHRLLSRLLKVSILRDRLKYSGLTTVLLVEDGGIYSVTVLRVARTMYGNRHFLVVRVVHIWVRLPAVERLPYR